jgi:hypothetical protein
MRVRACLGTGRHAKLDAQISAHVSDWRNRETPLGVQFIIAVTDFKEETGGTQVRTHCVALSSLFPRW